MHYKQELFAQKTPYLQWLRAQEQQTVRQGTLGKRIHRLPFFSCMDSAPHPDSIEPASVYLFVRNGGTLSEHAENMFAKLFSDNREAVLAYADEDYRGTLRELYGIEDGAFGEEITAPYRFGDTGLYRGAPWFKPDFSPDTLASFFYIGSVFAVRGDAVQKTVRTYGNSISLYELVYRIFTEAPAPAYGTGIVHIPRVLYTNDELKEADRLERSDRIRHLAGLTEDTEKAMVSVIIPSRDNADVLRKCLETLINYTCYDNYEIIIVDNGSREEQKASVGRILDGLQKSNTCPDITYLYEKMDFNFSVMCNIGAEAAKGTYLLFLNDDIEVMDSKEGGKWLDDMLAYARKRHVGAVGAKLYYPAPDKNGCYIIQHAGITSMGIGPAHKLGGMADEGCLYHGHNLLNYDMLAVTAACMLIKRSTFDGAGGFDEELAVAYNDVELCFRLYRAGLFNVQVNDAALIHHESLSRGRDTSPEKISRLDRENRILYKKHPLFKAKDPFYSPNLVQWKKDAAYNINYLYEYDKVAEPVFSKEEEKRQVFRNRDFRAMLYAKCRQAGKVYDRITGYHLLQYHIDTIEENADTITITGWHLRRNRDNADLQAKIWLRYVTGTSDHGSVYEFDIVPKLREDVAALFEGSTHKRQDNRTKNTALSGIHVTFKKEGLKPGAYGIDILTDKKQLIGTGSFVTVRAGREGVM